jgi:ATP-dependent RNA helicase RhlE
VSAAESVDQVVYLVDDDRKRELLAHLVRSRDLRQVLVFTRTKQMAGRLASWLDRAGVEATAIHGDRSQPEREKALEAFKSGEVRVLVAADVAARGLDIEALPQVVNFELPVHAQDYVHRIGRTGRAGMEGHAISLVSFEEEDRLMEVNRLLKRDLPVRVISGYEPSPRSMTSRSSGNGRGRTSPARRSAVSPRSRPARAPGSRDRDRRSSQPAAG